MSQHLQDLLELGSREEVAALLRRRAKEAITETGEALEVLGANWPSPEELPDEDADPWAVWTQRAILEVELERVKAAAARSLEAIAALRELAQA